MIINLDWKKSKARHDCLEILTSSRFRRYLGPFPDTFCDKVKTEDNCKIVQNEDFTSVTNRLYVSTENRITIFSKFVLPLTLIIIIIIIIKICKIDKIWKEYFYHIPNQVNVPGLVTAAILAIILLQKWSTAFQSESSNTRFLLSYHVPLHSCKCS